MGYLTIREAAEQLRMSEHSVRNCIRAGAPVYHWGAAGRQYRIDLDAFVAWMTEHGKQEHDKRQAAAGTNVIQLSAAEMERRRHELLKSMQMGA